MSVFEWCQSSAYARESKPPCSSDAAKAVTNFAASPNLEDVPNPAEIDAARSAVDSARSAYEDGQDETLVGLRTLLATGGGQADLGRTPSSTGDVFAGLGFPSAAFAVTDFLIARAKAELVQNTFVHVTDALKTGDLCRLLPNSRRVLEDADELSHRALLPTFKAAVREDFKALPRNISKDLSIYSDSAARIYSDTTQICPDSAGKVPESTAKRPKPPEEIRLLSAVGDAFMRLESGTDILVVLSELHVPDEGWENDELKKRLRFFSAFAKEFSKEFRATGGFAHANPARSFLDSLLSDPTTAMVFSAFLLSELQAHAAKVGDDVNVPLNNIRDLAVEFAGLVAVMRPRSSQSDERFTPNRASVAGKIAAVFETAVPLLTGDATKAQSFRKEIRLAHSLWSAIEGRDYHRIVVLVANRLADLPRAPQIPIRLLSFAGSVASADDAEDLREALEALADPVGSFRSRRGSRAGLRASLVSYVGVGVGSERITGYEKSGYWGAFAPIGIELSMGVNVLFVKSIGLMGSFADLGTLVSYRLQGNAEGADGGEDPIDDLPAVNVQHVFSPALSVVFGLSENHPLSVGLTWQRAPRLRTLTETGDQLTAVRLSGFVAIDLTLLRF